VTVVWEQAEIRLSAADRYTAAYLGVGVWADFTDERGEVLRRPAFYDGNDTWGIRFAAPRPGTWSWRTDATVDDAGLRGRTGAIEVTESTDRSDSTDGTRGSDPLGESRFRRHGFWRMSPSRRSLVHADGTPAVLVADTAWALPWRASEADVALYAANRRAKGFNAALLMSVQPDMNARGPSDRAADEGFDVAFEDLPRGRLTRLDVRYFRTLDRLLDILVDHEIVPVLQPVFQGFGWKGLDVAGTVVPPADYARYCRYLVARYGAAPLIYLVGADGWGTEPQIEAGGREVHAWDCYGQPTGVHYNPSATNREHQDAEWLDFQWCQTGHAGDHVPERVADMWRNQPPKAVANGEPTYERTRTDTTADGWWQGHEAWSNLCAGGTMGVVYGAANVWQWKHHPDEPGHSPYFLAASGSWRDALDFPGATHVGLVGRILDGLPTTDMSPDWSTFLSPRGLQVPGRLQITYQANGGPLMPMRDDGLPSCYRIVDPRTGETVEQGTRAAGCPIDGHAGDPRVVIFCDDSPQAS
jgi:hypothetical protein